MEIERTVTTSDNLATMLSFRRACLDCEDCTGMCWQFFEMRCVPDAVLKCDGRAE
ncbi:MAG: hypothetical protein JKY94_13450 [Rhodobacteraceae bacterium]|nr:hypothetical protein [Paracoccaceae bacterium]